MQLAIVVAIFIALPKAGFSQIAHRVKDINETASAAGSTFVAGVTIGNVTYFGADDGLNAFEFWRTDGTTAGTWLVKDLQPGRFGSNASNYRIFNGKVFFTANNGLYSSDGTAEGTVRIATANTSFSLTVVGNTAPVPGC